MHILADVSQSIFPSLSRGKLFEVLAISAIVAFLLSASTMVLAHANHQYRTEWEAHGAQSGAGGMRANIKVQSPSVSSCSNLALPCTHTMVYEYQISKGHIGAGWLKYKDAGGGAQIRGLVYWKDYVTGSGFYVLGNTLTSGNTYLFEAKKQNTDSNSSCWYGVTPGYTESRCMSDFKWGDPRVSGRLNNLSTSFGTTIGTFTSTQNRAITSNTWVNFGQDAFYGNCVSTSGTLTHMHQGTFGYTTAHISPPSQAGETNTGCGGFVADDLGG